MTCAAGEVRIGISGWRYEPWRGIFYPRACAEERARVRRAMLPTIEINGSFYSLQRPESYAEWYDDTLPGFVFALKGSRYITHMLKLRNVGAPLANFFASGVLRLRDKLGPILWQFPPQLGFDAERFDAFFSLCRATAAPRSRSLAPRRAPRRPRLARDRSRPAAPPRGRDPPPELRRPGVHRPAAPPPHRPRRRRHGRSLAAPRGPDRRLRLRPPARRQGALRERLRRRCARSLGGASPPGATAARSTMPASRRRGREGRARAATSIATSTTTSRCTRRTTPPTSRPGSASPPASSPAIASCRRRTWHRQERARRRSAAAQPAPCADARGAACSLRRRDADEGSVSAKSSSSTSRMISVPGTRSACGNLRASSSLIAYIVRQTRPEAGSRKRQRQHSTKLHGALNGAPKRGVDGRARQAPRALRSRLAGDSKRGATRDGPLRAAVLRSNVVFRKARRCTRHNPPDSG
jgi:hypothetical protein